MALGAISGNVVLACLALGIPAAIGKRRVTW